MNWKELPYRTKNKWLLTGFVFLLVLSYFFGIQNTLEAVGLQQELKQDLKEASNAPEKIVELEGRLKHINATLGQFGSEEDDIQEKLLDFITHFSKEQNLTIRSIPKPLQFSEENINVTTYAFTMQGNFKPLINLLYQLEQDVNIGRIASVTFEKARDRKTRNMILTETVYIQTINQDTP